MKTTRRTTITALFALALAACGGGEPATGPTGVVPAATSLDMVLGSDDAPITIIEYSAITCGACAAFNAGPLKRLKEDYVQEGKVRIVSREFLLQPQEINLAGFAIARCAGDGEAYFNVLDDLFTNQAGILSAVRAGAGLQALEAVAARHGMDNAGFEACLANAEVKQEINDVFRSAVEAGVNSTPTVYLNGRELITPESRPADGMAAIIDAALALQE